MNQSSEKFSIGLELLSHPVLPLIRIIHFLYLTGPFNEAAEILAELKEPIETNSAVYQDPAALLREYLPILENLRFLKNDIPLDFIIVDEAGLPLDRFEALELWISQKILMAELEQINSQLCHPCGCDLCCVGPTAEMQQEYFEIPLASKEVELFPVKRIDTANCRRTRPESEPSFTHNGPGVYHWQNGWSLILPKMSRCPNLASSGACQIYSDRPDVCRRPQIFAYVIERAPEGDRERDGLIIPAYSSRRKILAVWDCPYVQELKEDIARFGEACELEIVFRENKA